MSDKLERVRARVAAALAELEPMFPGYKLTFVARHEDTVRDADVIVSSESDLSPVAAVLAEHAHREAPYVCPGCHAVGEERCAPGCIDAEREMQAQADRDEFGDSDRWDDDGDADGDW